MNFSNISRATTIGKLLRLPLRLIPSEMSVPVLQGKLKGQRWIIGSQSHGCWLGSYEADKQVLFDEIVKADSVVYDIGANVGFYSLMAARRVGPSGKVYAFEPVPRNLMYLRKHLQLNHVSNVTVIEAAVSDRMGCTFFDEGPLSVQGFISDKGQLEVETVSLDGLIEQGRLQDPDYLKIDVEGAEALVLSGGRAMLERARPVIFLATHGEGVHRQCCALLISVGYELRGLNNASVDETDEIIATPLSKA
jgi:FkbM family methyltransferase